MTVTISTPELHARINDIRLLDVRWRLGAPNGRPAHAQGHLPGAVYVDLESTLAAHPGPADGRHPLPDRAALQEAVRAWGVNEGDTVVPTTTPATWRRPVPGGCCGTPALTSGCWTVVSRRGRRPAILWSPAT